MLRYALRRLVSLALSLAAASLVIFLAIEIVPGDPASYMLGLNAQPDTVAALRTELGLDVSRHAFVATATATGLIVDFARMPVYVALQYQALLDVWRPLVIACLGVLVGTVVGTRVLRKLPEKVFRAIVAVLLLGLGFWILVSQIVVITGG